MFIDSFQCSLRLQIARSTVPGEVIVTLHNTIPGSTYHLLSKEDLNLPEWTLTKPCRVPRTELDPDDSAAARVASTVLHG